MKSEELRIKPPDLRLGNWVMYDNRYFQISMIADVFPELNTTEFGIGVVDYNNIKPIPLSEEVLLKSGFERISNFTSGLEIEILYYQRGKIIVYHLKDFFEVEIETSSGIFNLHKSFKKHLHQLQNLYYALTGEELEVKLSS